MASNLFDLSGEVAVVFGGTGVLGGAMADALAAAGAKVASSAAARNAAAAGRAIEKAGGQAMFQSADAMSTIRSSPHATPS